MQLPPQSNPSPVRPMVPRPDTADALLADAAEYRAAGCRWSVVAWRLGVPEADLRRAARRSAGGCGGSGSTAGWRTGRGSWPACGND